MPTHIRPQNHGFPVNFRIYYGITGIKKPILLGCFRPILGYFALIDSIKVDYIRQAWILIV